MNARSRTKDTAAEVVTRSHAGRAAERTGGVLMKQARHAGRGVLLFVDTCAQVRNVGSVLPQLMRQVEMAGFGSIVVLALIAGLTGMIMAMQTGFELQKMGLQENLGAIIGATFLREMGPIWCAIIILARVGAAMAAEIGTMVVNEEVDALRVMSINPVRYLVLPRVLALVISMPLLTAIADFVGLAGGALVSEAMFDVTIAKFKESAILLLNGPDFWYGVFKSGVFACIIGTIACDRGLNTTDGAEGVGRATTSTVVLSVVFVLVSDFILNAFIQAVMRPIFG
ncbi:MAG TPA: ABC transporter permease [Planctomycetes bacterium]|nr:ABC transporter permease [Planctomycetota bacterium]